MKRLFADLARRFTGGDTALAARPILAGYRREMTLGWRLSILVALAVLAFAYGVAFGRMAPAAMMPLIAPMVLLSGLVIWALPAGDYAPTPMLEPMFIAFFGALVLWPNYLAIALPSLPWLTMLRIIGVPLLGVLFVCISVSSVFRSRLWSVLRTDRAILLLMVGFLVVQTVILPISRDPGMSINKWVVSQVNWTCIFVVACIVFIRPGFAEYWVRVLIAMLFLLCALGLWEARLTHIPWANHIPSFVRIEDEAVLRMLQGTARAASGIYRVQGPSTTPLGFAELLGLGIPFAMHLMVGSYRLVTRIVGMAFIPLALTVIIFTDSRLGVVAAIASLLFYFLIWALLRWSQDKRSLFAPAVVIAYPAFFLTAVSATFFIGRLRHQVWGDGSQQASTDSRIEQWNMAVPKILQNPIGYGSGQGADVLGYRSPTGLLTIDSYYISILLEFGILGFLIYYSLIIRVIWVSVNNLVKNKNSHDRELNILLPLSVSLINYFIIKSVLSQDANHPLVFMMMGAAVALIYRIRNQDNVAK